MDNLISTVLKVVGGIMGAIAGLFGDWTNAYTVLIALMVLDYITGVGAAIKEHSVSSSYGFFGIFKKLMMGAMVLLAILLDRAIGNATVFRDAVVTFYIVNESISIIENGYKLGIPFPEFIKKSLKEISDNTNNGIDNNSK